MKKPLKTNVSRGGMRVGDFLRKSKMSLDDFNVTGCLPNVTSYLSIVTDRPPNVTSCTWNVTDCKSNVTSST